MTDIETVRSGHVVIGVDTHKHIHVAAVMDSVGGILATLTIATDTAGFRQLLEWATGFGKIIAFGIEGGTVPTEPLSPRSSAVTGTR